MPVKLVHENFNLNIEPITKYQVKMKGVILDVFDTEEQAIEYIERFKRNYTWRSDKE